MTIDTKTLISISEANQNFSKVARLVDEYGSAVILKNNIPRYLVIDFSKAEQESFLIHDQREENASDNFCSKISPTVTASSTLR